MSSRKILQTVDYTKLQGASVKMRLTDFFTSNIHHVVRKTMPRLKEFIKFN